MRMTLFAFVICFATTSCSGSIQRPLKEVVSCVKQEADLITVELAKLAALVPDWKAVSEAAIEDARETGYRIVGCALASLASKHKAAPIAGSSPARDALETFRAKAAMGAEFDLGPAR